ncbi:hypothetical protein CO046_00390 [Candidatus Peregrinibacteria bacterium CG_4_9_14_0_2_um_filter_53_11]|nr:MAG: hypothetical protein CO046_00390 [Candidatus Peregrinibacteria bacterium CG_4_9_14_0_2_um_filter_53_11]
MRENPTSSLKRLVQTALLPLALSGCGARPEPLPESDPVAQLLMDFESRCGSARRRAVRGGHDADSPLIERSELGSDQVGCSCGDEGCTFHSLSSALRFRDSSEDNCYARLNLYSTDAASWMTLRSQTLRLGGSRGQRERDETGADVELKTGGFLKPDQCVVVTSRQNDSGAPVEEYRQARAQRCVSILAAGRFAIERLSAIGTEE